MSAAWARPKDASVLVGQGRHELYSFDLAGRLVEAYRDGVSYRRGLDNRVLERRTDRSLEGLSRRRRRLLSPGEARALVDRAVACAQAAPQLPPGFRVLTFDELVEDARAFARIWQPIGILPPDQYLSVVLQLTCGCWYNRCTFCTFYRGRPFHVLGLDDFRRHIEEVKAFFGAGLLRRTGVFLGDANALVLPTPRLTAALEAAAGAFPGLEVAAFLDAFSGRRKSATEWAHLASAGLKRVYVGLESGSDAVLDFLQKPGTAADALAAVRAMRAGGVAVGVILLVGAGGRLFADDHVRRSVEVVNAMELGRGDWLFLSPLVVAPDSPYVAHSRRAGVVALSPEEMEAQAEALLAGIRLGPGARWAYYFVEEFLY